MSTMVRGGSSIGRASVLHIKSREFESPPLHLIELTKNRVSIVDGEDIEWLTEWPWHTIRRKVGNTGYASRTVYSPKRTLMMHIAILKHHGLWQPEMEVDHINNCGFDNRKENLRLVTQQDQMRNSSHPAGVSGVRGVRWNRKLQRWYAIIGDGACHKEKYLGSFAHKKDAIAARRKAEIERFGEFCYDPINVCPLGATGKCLECAARLAIFTKEMENESIPTLLHGLC